MLNREPPPAARATTPGRRLRAVLIVVVVATLFGLSGLATLWTDYLWYGSVGLTSVWRINIFTGVALVIVASVVAFFLLWINLAVASRISPRIQLLSFGDEEELVERFQDWVEPRLRRVRLVAAVLFGIVMGTSAAAWRDQVLLFANPMSFGAADPVFSRDISFFVFGLPLWRTIQSWLFNVTGFVLLLVIVVHYLNAGIRLRRGALPEVSAGVKAHLSVLLAVLALLRAIGYRLDAFELNYSTSGFVFGAGYTDIQARLPALNLLALISVAAAALLIVNIWRRGWLLVGVALGGWLVVSIIVGAIIPAAVQRFQVEPAEREREAPYIQRNIDATRAAYGLDDVVVKQFAASPELTADDLEVNDLTINNIRLWDPSVISKTYSNLQEIRTYYRLDNVDVDRYRLGDELVQVLIAPRELDERNLPVANWQNETLVYTHGYGAVLSRANEVNREQGQPEFLVKDVPPVSSVPELDIAQPGVYFGETYERGKPVIVASDEAEVDYPLSAGGEDSFSPTSYDGEAGVSVTGLMRRAAFALRYRDLNILITDRLNESSKILMVRNVREAAHKAAPFLFADNDPYVVVLNGRLVWVLDLYTVTDRYPYAAPAAGNTRRLARTNDPASLGDRFNYIRNSVKATVDAYDGTMTFYVVDDSDPIIRSYRQIYPDVFTDQAIPDELRSHFRYPEDLFRVQSDVYRAYHIEDTATFFAGEDAWSIPQDVSDSEQAEILRGDRLGSAGTVERLDEMLPYYLLMRLPGEDQPSYVILQPFNPQGKRNMASFLVAKSDPGSYGELIDYRLPRDRFIDGPAQVEARIDQDPEISPVFTLWNQQGSDVIRGSLLVVPIEESVVYFQPIYLQGVQNPLPEFKRVVVVFQDRITMRETLDEALFEVFGGAAPPPPDTGGPDVPVSGDVEELLRLAQQRFQEAEAALQAGDLGEYQAKTEEARRLLDDALSLLVPGNV